MSHYNRYNSFDIRQMLQYLNLQVLVQKEKSKKSFSFQKQKLIIFSILLLEI